MTETNTAPLPTTATPAAPASADTQATSAVISPVISIDEFAKVDLRVAEILTAEPVEKSKKLLKLQLSLGSELGTRQIVAGIAKDYEPDTLAGRKIVIISNLAPATLAGVESNGMLLASTDGAGRVIPLDPGQDSIPGSRVR
jgi:methionyl-tRNA synthetase